MSAAAAARPACGLASPCGLLEILGAQIRPIGPIHAADFVYLRLRKVVRIGQWGEGLQLKHLSNVDLSLTMIAKGEFQCGPRYPNVRMIFSHSGGTMPFLYERFARASEAPKIRERMPAGFLAEIQRFFYDTAQASHEFALASLTRLIPISQILFGSDAPYRHAADFPPQLQQFGFSDADLRAIDYENALRLLPNLRTSRAV